MADSAMAALILETECFVWNDINVTLLISCFFVVFFYNLSTVLDVVPLGSKKADVMHSVWSKRMFDVHAK